MRAALASALLMAAVLESFQAVAQENQSGESESSEVIQILNKRMNESALTFAYGNPVSPALALAGLKTSDVTQVNQFRDFLITVPKLTRGEETIAIDVSPFRLLKPTTNMEDLRLRYDNNSILKYADRLQFSTVLQNGITDADNPENSKKALVSMGLSMSVLDNGNPIFDAYKKVDKCQPFIVSSKTVLAASISDSLDALFENSLDLLIVELNTPLTHRELIDKTARYSDLLSEIKFSDPEYFSKLPKTKSDAEILAMTPEKYQDELFSSVEIVIKMVKNLPVSSVARADRSRGQTANRLVKSYDACNQGIKEHLINKPNLDIGGAVLWRGSTDGFGEFKSGGQALWVSYRQPLNNSDGKDLSVVAGLSSRISFSEDLATGNEMITSGKADTIQGWGGIEVNKEKWRFAGRVGYVEKSFSDATLNDFSEDGTKWLVSSDLRIADNIWLGMSYGKAAGTNDLLEGEQLTLDIKFSEPTAISLFK